MSVSGLLSSMNLPELLQWVKFGQKTGTFVFERRGTTKKIVVEKGLVVSASSSDPREYLGQILLCFGLITEEKLAEAFSLQKGSGKLLGKILLESMGLKEAQIVAALRMKIEETIYDIFLWDEGRFLFQEQQSNYAEHERLSTALTIDQVMFEGARRLDEWKEFKKQYPTDDVVFAPKAKVGLGELQKNYLVAKIFSAIDGRSNLRRVLLETRAPEYRGTEAVAKLVWGGFIEVVKKPHGPKSRPLSDGDDYLAQAKASLEMGQIEESYGLSEEAIFRQPENLDAIEFHRLVGDLLLDDLRKKFPGELVPELVVDLVSLESKMMSPKESFLASRVNGLWNVKSLVMVSPLGELESLIVLKKLYEQGVVRFDSRKG